MLRKKLKRIIMIALLISSIFLSIVSKSDIVMASSIKQVSQQVTYSQQIKNSKPKILIYHSHTFEKYNDNTSVYEVGEDLAKKLEAQGIIVEHINTDFSKDYKTSYSQSRKMLITKDLNDYALIIDLHRDSGEKATVTTIDDIKYARTMFVNAYESPNRDNSLHIANYINKELSKHNQGMHINKDVYEKHRKSSNVYNADLSENMLLIEMGNSHNTKDECENTNTYLSSAIITYISENLK